MKIVTQKGDHLNDKRIDYPKIMEQIFIIKGFQVLRLIIFILLLSYFLGTMWFIMTKHSTEDPEEFTFYNVYTLEDRSNFDNISVVMYFMFTTLSTVGFGDFNPKSEIERLIMTFILLIGVACFSYIMSQFIAILLEVQIITADNEDSETLSRWMLVLKNFNKNKPLPPEYSRKFEKYFEYYWRNDKNYAITTPEDLEIFVELPPEIQGNIYKDFLFQDFLKLFEVHFTFRKPES